VRERRFLIDPSEIRDGKAYIHGTEHRHLARVLRLRPGDQVIVFDGRGRGYQARLDSVGESRAVASLGEPESDAVESPVELTVFQAILHGERMEGIAEKITELGARRLVPVISDRGVVQPSGGRWGKLDRWRRICAAAAKQSGRLVVPEISEPVSFGRAILWPNGEVEGAPRYLLEAGGKPLRALAAGNPAARAAILVGPEGGWTEAEIARALEAGWAKADLGPRTLRADTAAVVAAAAVLLPV
jgi:16S rRNA (uracil1498-N3)-methyltransferase